MVYSYINSKKAVKENISAINDEMGKRVYESGKIVKILNNLFISVFEIDNGKISDLSEVKEYLNKIER